MDELLAVALPADGSIARRLLIRASQMACDLGVPWAAFFIRSSGVRSERLSEAERVSIVQALSFAAHLGGTPICCDAEDVSSALLALAAREHVRLLILGSSQRSPLLQRLFPGTTQRVLRADRTFDVVIAAREKTA